MQINPERLSELRDARGFSRAQLAEKSNVSERQIRRLEATQSENRNGRVRETTLKRLAKALRIEPSVLTGESPLPDSGRAATTPDAIMRTQIGAQIAPKARLAYDLARHRYGVSVTEIINMAPLFFVLLAEDSLAWRREKLEEASEAISRLEQINDKAWCRIFSLSTVVAQDPDSWERESIDKADIFGEQSFKDYNVIPDDLSEGNPFASYLSEVANTLKPADGSGVVGVEGDDLGFGSSMRFPDYNVCRGELDSITNGSSKARIALEHGFARLSDIPKELMIEDSGEKRSEWLEGKVPDVYMDDVFDGFRERYPRTTPGAATPTPDDIKELIEKATSQVSSKIERGGNGQ